MVVPSSLKCEQRSKTKLLGTVNVLFLSYRTKR